RRLQFCRRQNLLGRFSGGDFLVRRRGGPFPGDGGGLLFPAPPAPSGTRMIRLTSLDAIERFYAEKGGLHYGEGVTQIEHALQSAALAQAQACPPSLIAAALL